MNTADRNTRIQLTGTQEYKNTADRMQLNTGDRNTKIQMTKTQDYKNTADRNTRIQEYS